MYGLAALALLAPLQAHPKSGDAVGMPEEPNFLIVILDDIGRDLLSAYDSESPTACTPTIDRLAANGMVFHNAWSNPVCSPSRAQVLTGRYAFRTGVGSNVGRWQFSTGLATSEVTLPEVLPNYRAAAVGKWHLAHPTAQDEGPSHPNNSGFNYFSGSMSNLIHGPQGSDFDYFEWLKLENGNYSVSHTYATTDTADEAIFAAGSLPEPWVIMASFHAPHHPLHEPPRELLTCTQSEVRELEARQVRKMVNAVDTELGRVLANLGSEAVVILVGDNGSSEEAILPPYDPTHGKGSMYEGGVGVPLIIAGPGIQPGDNHALVSSTDIFATVTELAGVNAYAEDSVSLVPYLFGNDAPRREFVYAERFSPNGYDSDYEEYQRAIRNERYKLILVAGSHHEFYDLQEDPQEQVNLIGNMNIAQMRAYARLLQMLP